MPRPNALGHGLAFRLMAVALLLAAQIGCGSLPEAPAAPPPPPSVTTPPASAAPNWVQNLNFSGDLSGNMARIAPPGPNQNSECSGKNSKAVGTWASTLYGPVGAEVFGIVVLSSSYRGPATYDQVKTSVQVYSQDKSRVWQSLGADLVSFTVNPDEESGSIDATLTNLSTNKSKLKVSGRWSCRS
jgi:hypothetical protein